MNKQTDGAIKAGRVARTVSVAMAGAAIGYVAGTLTAPASGQETRRRIGRRIDDETHGIARKARRSLATAKEGAQGFALKARRSLTDAKNKLRG